MSFAGAHGASRNREQKKEVVENDNERNGRMADDVCRQISNR